MSLPASRIWRYQTAVLTVLAVGGLAVYIGAHGEEVRGLLTANPKLLVGAFGVYVLRLFVTALANRTMLAARDLDIGRMECFWLASVSNACNLVLPLQTGAAFRAVYLKRRHSFAYVDFIATMFGTQLLFFIVTSATALICISVLVPPAPGHGRIIGILLSAICLGGGVLMSLLPRLTRRGNWLYDKLAAVTEGWHELRKHRWLLLKVSWLAFLLRCCDAACFWFAFQAAGLHVPLLSLLALTSVGAIASVVSITPASLGTYELLVGVVSGAVGQTAVQAVAVALMCRTVAVLRTAVIAPVGFWCLSRRLGDLRQDDDMQPTRARLCRPPHPTEHFAGHEA